jgi:hypothetical protein
MKRLVLIVAGLGIVVAPIFSGLAMSGSAVAATPSGLRQVPSPGVHHEATPGTEVTAGSTWTLYSVEGGAHQYCTIISFGALKKFTDDQGGSGTWKGSTKSTTINYAASDIFSARVTFKGSWITGDGGYWNGVITEAGTTYGPLILTQGANPFGWDDAVYGNASC